MSLAIPRQSIIDNVAQGGQLPATGFTPKGMPGFDVINPELSVAARRGRHGAGEAADERGRQPEDETSRSTSTTRRATARSPSRSRPPGRSSGSRARSSSRSSSSTWSSSVRRRTQDVDVYRLGWIGDFVDAINFLDLWTCESGNNNTNYCNKEYDATIEKARNTVDNDARYELYGEAEDILFGENGDMPIMPIYFYT